jgi:LDH2 family malate/lactate/ureidoglycolate dehydrogenase
MTAVRALLLEPDDDVAAALAPVPSGGRIAVTLNASGAVLREIEARQAIPFGHKFAVRALNRGGHIKRYGYPIGAATADIAEGEHVHTHNMRSLLSPIPKENKPAPAARPAAWVRGLVKNVLAAAGAIPDAADAMADAITEAHLRGVETHGLRRLRPYVARIRSGGVDAGASPQLERDEAVLRVDGRNGIGHYVAACAARAVSAAASERGIALALVRNSNHFGFAGYYATLIAEHDQIGIVSSNGQVCVAPAGGKAPLLSNNPLALAAPTGRADMFLELDLATSVTSRANVVEAAKSRTMLPPGLAQDSEGVPTRDPKAALDGSLLAFGGAKGFALLLAIETLTGVLGGGAYADQVSSKEASPNAPEGTGHTMIAIDLKRAIGSDAFSHRLDDLLRRLAGLPTHDGAAPPRYPGERRWALRRERMRYGIPLTAAELDDLSSLARELGVESS